MNKRCLICAGPNPDFGDYHSACLKSFFGSDSVPEIPFMLDELDKLGTELIDRRVTVPGVQKKLSLHLSEESGKARLTFVGVMGDYILKTPVEAYPELPENEFLTMHLAEIFGIKTVPYSLIRMKSGEAAYITKRIDRNAGGKIHMEDMCQLSGKMTDEKYRGSYEQIGKLVSRHCDNRMFDVLRFFEIILFSYVTANGDMHLKNFSLMETKEGISLAPAYDLINTRLVISEQDDPEESALALCGKRNKFQKKDFIRFGESLDLNSRQIENAFKRLNKNFTEMLEAVNTSFLSRDLRLKYSEIIKSRAGNLLEI